MNYDDPHIAIIIKHLSGEATLNEEQLLSKWLNESELNQKEFDKTKSAWELVNEKLDPEVASININNEWNKLSEQLSFNEKNNIIDFVPLKKESNFGWIKIAATILILIAIGGGWYLLSPSKEVNLVATNKIIENKLPDGSNIVLKEKSSLSYDNEYNQVVRKVVLKGEAYFEVEPDKEKPFIVETGNIIVKVLGTSFLVKNNEQKKLSEVIVTEGKVLVYNAVNEKDSLVITAGEKASFEEKSVALIKGENLDPNYIAWKTKNFTFDNTSLNDVIKTINYAYNSNIVIKNKKLNYCRLTFSLENQSLESVLKVIEATINVKVKKRGEKIEISGEGCENIPTN